jgi:hypothetical protein
MIGEGYSGRYWDTSIYQYLVPVLQILEDSGTILVLPVLCTILVIPVSRPAASYYPLLFSSTCNLIERIYSLLKRSSNPI